MLSLLTNHPKPQIRDLIHTYGIPGRIPIQEGVEAVGYHWSQWAKYAPILGVKTIQDFEESTERKPKQWRDYLMELLIAPEHVLRHFAWLPSTQQEKNAVCAIVFQNALKVAWLDYLVPGDKPKPSVLKDPLAIKMRSHAYYSKAVLDLCVYLHEDPRLEDFPEDIPGAATWKTCESQSIYHGILGSGLVTGAPDGGATTKTRWAEEALEANSVLDDPCSVNFVRDAAGTIKPGRDKVEALEAITSRAIWLAQEDIQFRYSKVYVNFKEQQKAYFKSARKPGFFLLQYQDGDPIPAGRKGPRQPRRDTARGFAN